MSADYRVRSLMGAKVVNVIVTVPVYLSCVIFCCTFRVAFVDVDVKRVLEFFSITVEFMASLESWMS